jgi:hypothetical protein
VKDRELRKEFTAHRNYAHEGLGKRRMEIGELESEIRDIKEELMDEIYSLKKEVSALRLKILDIRIWCKESEGKFGGDE